MTPAPLNLTRAIGRLAAHGFDEPIPDAASKTVSAGFTDLVACILAGRNEPLVDIVKALELEREGDNGTASVLFTGARASSQAAALINGAAAHALDYDDVGLIAHPSTVLVPPLLAEGERLGCSGAALIRAYLVGYEAWAELSRRDPAPYHQKGWHPTSTLGMIGATAAVAALNGCDEKVAANAVAIAASLASGIAANFGTMTKPVHAGHAASSAVTATRLAIGGLTAAEDALEHPAGLLAALSPKGEVDLGPVPASFGKELAILEGGLSFKKYPICYATHRVIDVMLEMIRDNDLDASAVERVTAEIGPTQAAILRNGQPQTALEAKFSLQFAVASCLIARNVSLRELTDSFVARAEVQDVMRRVEVRIANTQCPVEPAFSYADRAWIRLRDGRTLDSGEIRFASGHAQRPLEPKAAREKFDDCCDATDFAFAGELWKKLSSLADLENARDLACSPNP
ncbi:MmgE/PrpD family protein [Afifella sp. IM 167]|uniref:MmgE/PrpD family protein n=1 Tax=Afifella sp. IM 167 TaxID=2033586 RepID=UPI001CC9BAAF|nr:MmgE/PrpD family protein [Afifella sp. IM 167]